MKREDIKMLLQVMAAGFLFVLTVPAVMVFFFGEMGSGNHVLPGKQTGFPGKIETPDTIRVWLEDKEKAVTVDFEAYVCRVVASEMPHTFEEEALRAQSVAARTYAMAKVVGYEESRSKAHPEAPVCSSTHCQVYKTEKALIKAHEDGWEDT